MIALLPAAALGATPVVYETGTGPEAIAAVVQRTGLPPDQLEAVAADSLLTGPPRPVGSAALRRCSGAGVPQSDVDAELARAAAAFASGDLPGAANQLDLVVARIGCLSEVARPETIAKAFRLRSEVAWKRGEADTLAVEIRAEVAFDREQRLPPPTDPTHAQLLVAERAASAAVPVLPLGAPSSGPWLDGRALAGGATVSPGVHLLQVAAGGGVQSGWLTVGADPLPIVFPTGFRKPFLAGLATADPSAPNPIAMLVAATLDAPAAYVVAGGGIWLVDEEGGQVSTTTLVLPPAPSAEDGKGKSGGKRR